MDKFRLQERPRALGAGAVASRSWRFKISSSDGNSVCGNRRARLERLVGHVDPRGVRRAGSLGPDARRRNAVLYALFERRRGHVAYGHRGNCDTSSLALEGSRVTDATKLIDWALIHLTANRRLF